MNLPDTSQLETINSALASCDAAYQQLAQFNELLQAGRENGDAVSVLFYQNLIVSLTKLLEDDIAGTACTIKQPAILPPNSTNKADISNGFLRCRATAETANLLNSKGWY